MLRGREWEEERGWKLEGEDEKEGVRGAEGDWEREREGEVLCFICYAHSGNREECNGSVPAIARSPMHLGSSNTGPIALAE